MLLTPVGVVALVSLGLVIGLALAPLGLLYDDVGRVVTLMTTFWFFLTPVVYPLPARGVLYLNPVTPLLIASRARLGGRWYVSPGFFMVVGSALAGLAIVVWFWYRLARPHVVSRQLAMKAATSFPIVRWSRASERRRPVGVGPVQEILRRSQKSAGLRPARHRRRTVEPTDETRMASGPASSGRWTISRSR